MLVNEVALGHCLDVFEHNTDLKQPPEGYDSVHGVRKQDGIHSQFTVDILKRIFVCHLMRQLYDVRPIVSDYRGNQSKNLHLLYAFNEVII